MKKLLVINAGSSSMKFKLFKKEKLKIIAEGLAERLFIDGKFTMKYNKKKYTIEEKLNSHDDAIKLLIKQLKENNILNSLEEIEGIGHRVVQGGEYFKKSTLINQNVLKKIEELSKLAPLHNPGAVSVIKSFLKLTPNIKNVAVFDTSYHTTISKENYIYAVPKKWYEKYSVRKYGAHGTSHKYMVEMVQKILNKNSVNIISCHLGNGASITAIKNNKSINTSMGLTPLAGLIMGTRSGNIDPSIIGYIAKETGKNVYEITNILNKKSGVLGLSKISSDFRDLENEALKGNKDAIFTIDVYCKKVVDFIVKYQNELENKIDAIVFTAGIGENSSTIRKNIIKNIHTIKTKINEKINDKKHKEEYTKISTNDSKIPIYIIKTNEELMILRDLIKVANL
jgi:acetate kinase